MNTNVPCPICGLSSWLEVRSDHFSVSACSACAHRRAIWNSNQAQKLDYYEAGNTTLSEAFVDSLLETRTRQSHFLIHEVQKLRGKNCGWLDYGAGRGALLQAIKLSGQRLAVGYDNSDLATEGMKKEGLTTLDMISNERRNEIAVLSLMDVLEHFENPLQKLRELTTEFSSVSLLVLKVPRADSLLYRAAKLLHRIGLKGPFRQLYQDGTWPPHFQYFSDHSLARMYKSIGFKQLKTVYDPDFDDIFTRLGFPPNFLLRALSKSVAPLFKESTIVFLERA